MLLIKVQFGYNIASKYRTDWIYSEKNYSDILYNSKILYDVNCICTNVPVKFEFEFITIEIQFNVKLFGDKQCHCKES